MKLSNEAKYLVANLYNGDVVVYELPEPPLAKPQPQDLSESILKNKHNNSSNNYEPESVLI